MKVSVVIPAYNAERYLADALESVAAQTRQPEECLVVDDGSTDATATVARSFPFVRYLQKANGGDASARNRGVEEAVGDVVAFLDSDDVWRPGKLEKQMALFETNPSLGMVYCGVEVVDDRLNHLETLRPAPAAVAFRNTLLVEKPYMTGVGSTGVVRTEIASRTRFDERLRASADWAFACRVAFRHEVAPVEEPLALYRQHAASQVHLNLQAVESDMKLTWQEIFSDPLLDHSIKNGRRRALANLHLSLAASHFKRGDRIRFLSQLLRASVTRPDRVVSAFWRRYMGPVN